METLFPTSLFPGGAGLIFRPSRHPNASICADAVADTKYGLQEKVDSEDVSEEGSGAFLGEGRPKEGAIESMQKGGA